MENNSRHVGPDQPADPPTASQARGTLESLNADGAKLAEQVATPWWYHPILGLIVALFIMAQTLSAAASLSVIALGVVALPLLTGIYNRRFGISTSQPAGPRSRRLLFCAVVPSVALPMLAAVAVKFTDIPAWWVLLPAALAFVLVVVLGRRYDDALRAELALNGDGRA